MPRPDLIKMRAESEEGASAPGKIRSEIKNYPSFQNDRTTMRMKKWSTELIHEYGTTLSFDQFNTGTVYTGASGRPRTYYLRGQVQYTNTFKRTFNNEQSISWCNGVSFEHHQRSNSKLTDDTPYPPNILRNCETCWSVGRHLTSTATTSSKLQFHVSISISI